MYSILSKTTTLLEINKSKFYTELIPINSIDDIDNILNDIKDKYKGATHYCYAYIFDNTKRFNDDGEPSGTAGMPILNVLEQNNLNHILAVVTRYFGGIKLGAGGLVRAYTNSVSDTINESKIIELINGKKISIEFTYDNSKQIDYLLKDYDIVNKEYSTNIIYTINIPNNINIKEILSNYVINYKEIDNILIKKED